MSIRLRFTIALTLVGVVLFSAYGVVSYSSERDDLQAASTREIRLLGRSLETALGNALRDRQRADIEEELATIESIEPNLDIHIHDAEGRPIAHSKGAELDDWIERFVGRAAATRAELVDLEPDRERLVFVAPLTDDDGTLLGSMALVRPINDMLDDLGRTRARILVVMAAFIIATVMSGLVLGSLYISKPLARILSAFRHVRDGDFRLPLSHAYRDEIGQLVVEYNAMIAALAAARERVERETEARVRLESGLQRVDKMITIGQLSAGLAHEIGSPLQVMSTRAELLGDHPDPNVQRQARLLAEQSERIAKIVEQLLSFGRHRAAQIAPIDLGTPVHRVVELMLPEARRRGVKLVEEDDAAPHLVEADADQVQQIALNLIRNALSATPAKGTITVRIESMESRVRLMVKDTGAGIPPEIRTKLFEPFFTTRAREGGTGLGLAVVQAIANEHRATIEVQSEMGHGTEMSVSFPKRVEHRA